MESIWSCSIKASLAANKELVIDLTWRTYSFIEELPLLSDLSQREVSSHEPSCEHWSIYESYPILQRHACNREIKKHRIGNDEDKTDEDRLILHEYLDSQNVTKL